MVTDSVVTPALLVLVTSTRGGVPFVRISEIVACEEEASLRERAADRYVGHGVRPGWVRRLRHREHLWRR